MWIVPQVECSCMNLWISAFSLRFRGSSHPGNEFGAPGSSSIAWSQIEWLGNLWDCSSLKTLWCCWYSAGIFDGGAVMGAVKVTQLMKYWSFCICWCFCVLCVYLAFSAFDALKMTRSWVVLIHPCFQLIHGWNTANQGYPSMALCSPRSDKKNLRLVVCCLAHTCKSMLNRSHPLLFSDLLTLNNGCSWERHLIGRHNHWVYPRFIKFSVTPESRKAIALALFVIDWV